MQSRRKESAEIIKLVSERFPKFTKVQLCMLRNPQYGVSLAPEAEAILRKNNKTVSLTPPPQKKKRTKQPEKKRISCRLSDEDYAKVKRFVEDSGYKSIQEYLEKLIEKSTD